MFLGDLPDKTKLTAWIHKSAVMVEAFGTAGSVAEIGEQLGWIGAALRSSKYDLGVGYCRPLIHFEDTQSLKMGILCKIHFSFQERGKYSEPSKGQCWHNLFKNPVVVEGFPIPRKTEIETGLEIPLHIMAALAQSQRVNTFDGKVFIKGFSTMLVLIKKNADLIIWHLLYNRDGNRISYLDNTVPLGENASVSDVEKARHVLGWCSEVKYYAGRNNFQVEWSISADTYCFTGAADAAYTIGRSGLNRSQAGALGNVQVFGGHIVAGSFPFGIGQKDIPVRLSRGGYIARLKWMSKKYVVLWDEHEKRGWLVNGTSTLLHLLRASLEYDLTDNFKSVLQFEPGEMQEASALHTAGSAIEVLINPTNMNLAIYPEKTGYIRVEDRIEQFYDILEKIIDHQTIVAGPGGVKLKSTPRRHLEGWDFRDLATNRDPFYPYVAKLQPPAKSWIDLIRTTHAITLFGRGFGEIFRPTGPNPCAHWATLPKEKYYLAASVSDLRDIMAMGGDQNSYPRKLSDDIIWYNPGKLFEPCQCTSEEEGEHSDLAQALLPSKFHKILPKKDLVPLEDRYEGAVIFGHNVNFKWFWKDNGDPEEGEPPTSPVSSPMSPKTQFHDSGISLDSPFAKSSGDLADSSSQQTLNERSFGKQVSDPTISETSKINEIDVQTATTLSLQSATLTPSHYAVGIVCALHKELLAVRSLFDRRHADLGIASDDTNHYALGVIGQHNVVAACLPSGEYGTNSAADVASHMRRSFSKIKFCLLVGIGGGVPSKENDIRLGDVVVSQPTDTHAGVVQYDLGKALENGIFQGTGCLQRPPRFLMTAISSLRSDPDLSTTPLQPYINEIETRSPKYRHQGQDQDKLFAAEYVHNPAHKICEPCDGPQIRRQPRPCNHPNIHYGLIASGNQVMKNAQIRDRLGQEHNVLCFEMEAAGVVNTLPCLVIRGICDYSDSHKNKLWQEYAAATAAAYAKLLLSAVRNSNDVESIPATLNKTKGKKRATSSSAVAKFPSPKKARGD
jgi:nucleoside phosphorylase